MGIKVLIVRENQIVSTKISCGWALTSCIVVIVPDLIDLEVNACIAQSVSGEGTSGVVTSNVVVKNAAEYAAITVVGSVNVVGNLIRNVNKAAAICSKCVR